MSKKNDRKKAKRKAVKTVPVAELRSKHPKITPEFVANIKARLDARKAPALTASQIFAPAKPPPGVLPKDVAEPELAMDDAFSGWAGGYFPSAVAEGQTFLGYPYLSELLQRAEYRRMVEVTANQMTRKWIKVISTAGIDASGTKDKSKEDQINKIEAEFKRLGVKDAFHEAVEHSEGFGRGHIYLDTGDTSKPKELITDLGDGIDAASKGKIGPKHPLRRLKPVEPIWTYPANYNATDPLDPAWYKPEQWYVMAKQIHASRLLTFIGREVADMLKPAYSFGGLSMVQMAKPYVDNWLRTRQSVSDIVNAFSVMVLSTDLGATLTPGGNPNLLARLDLFNVLRDNAGIMAVNKNTEDFKNVSAPLGTLDMLQAQTQEHMSAVSGIPLVFLLGIQPAGLNASSEGEIRVFYDWIAAYQEHLFRPNLTRVLRFVQLSLFGAVDPDIDFNFEPLWSMSEKEIAELKKAEAETDKIDIEVGAISNEERRKSIVADPRSRYSSIDPDDVPDLLEEEVEGLEPHASAEKLAGGEDDPAAGKKAPPRPAPKPPGGSKVREAA